MHIDPDIVMNQLKEIHRLNDVIDELAKRIVALEETNDTLRDVASNYMNEIRKLENEKIELLEERL